MANTKDFVPVTLIKNDMVVLNDGSMAIVIQTSAVNFDLLSENEQLAIIGSFAAMLNSLSFSIQIVIRSKKLDISHYLNSLKVAERKQTSPLLQLMMQRYRAFVEAIIRDNEVLDKQFFVVLAVSPVELGVVSSMNAEKNFPKAINLLGPRRDHIIKQLSRIGLKSTQLDDERLIKLFYDIYNDVDKISLADVQANPANATTANQGIGSRAQGIVKTSQGTEDRVQRTVNPQDQNASITKPYTLDAIPSYDQTPAAVAAQAKATNQGTGYREQGTVKDPNNPSNKTIPYTLYPLPSTTPSSSRQPLYSSSNSSRQTPFVVEELPA